MFNVSSKSVNIFILMYSIRAKQKYRDEDANAKQ